MSTYGCRPFEEEERIVTGQLLQERIGEEHLATRSGGAAGMSFIPPHSFTLSF